MKIGVFPDKWKTSFINRRYKNGDSNNIENYRPINKYNIFSKMLESLVYERMCSYLKKFIKDSQHGFMEKRSTITNLVVYLDYLTKSINNEKRVETIYTDLRRSFDMVNFDLLMRKLKAYGVNGVLWKWFNSFIRNKKQIVQINNALSYEIEVVSGVGQGAPLGPLLFLIYINDIVDVIKHSEILLFADDAKIFKVIESTIDEKLLQEDIVEFGKWREKNGCECNIDKCSVILFGNVTSQVSHYFLDGVEIRRVSSVKDLGVIFETKLIFKIHIDQVVLKARRQVLFIKRFTKKFKSIKTFRSLYFACVYPSLMYASYIWRPKEIGLIRKIEGVNTMFSRYATYRIGMPMNYTDHDFDVIYKRFGIAKIEKAMERNDLMFICKVVNGYIECSDWVKQLNFYIPPTQLRDNDYFFVMQNEKDVF